MTHTGWSDTADLGQKLKHGFNRMNIKINGRKSKKKPIEPEKLNTPELVSIMNSMGHVATQIINIKRSDETEARLDKMERILKYLPKEVLAEAVSKVNADK